jgi:SNF2 family DNA or RNA helicase
MNLEINFEYDELADLAEQLEKNKEKGLSIRDEIDNLYARIQKLQEKRNELLEVHRSIEVKIVGAKQRKINEQKALELRAQIESEEQYFKNIAIEVSQIAGELEGFKNLHAYQLEDVVSAIVAFYQSKRGMLNANDMGMGKTVESVVVIYILQKLLEKRLNRKPTVLWLTKKSLMKKSTPKEILKWNPTCRIVVPPESSSKKDREFLLELYEMQKADIFVANYEFARTTPKVTQMKWDIIVIDEVHKLKGGANANGPTAIFTAVKNLCEKAEYVLMLSGTPMVNAPEEMWSYLHIFNPEKFPDVKRFRRDFMGYREVAGEMQLAVDPNKILQYALKGQMIRRSAQEVGLQIPPLNYEIVELEMLPEQREVYNQMRDNFFIWLDENQTSNLSAAAIIAQLTRLRQINLWPVFEFTYKDEYDNEITDKLNVPHSSKVDETMDIIENVGDQVVVFSTLNSPMDEIKRRCVERRKTCEIINGSSHQSYDVEGAFQQGKIDVLCLNSAMGEGLNLQKNPEYWPGGASYGIMLDRWWSPARNEQCIKRIQRQGSTTPVFIYELQNVPSIDAFLQIKCDDKAASFASIMNANELRPGSSWKEYLGDLI